MALHTISRRRILKTAAALPLGAGMATAIIGKATAAPVRMRLATPFNSDPKLSPAKVFHDKLVEGVKKNCGDQIQIDMFPDSQLGSDADLIPQLKFGTVDLMMAGSAIWATVVPEVGILDLGYMFQDFAHFARALDGEVGKSLQQMVLDKAGVMVLGFSHSFGARNIMSKKQINTPEDLAGLKIRSLPSPPVVETVRAMGAQPTPIPIGEVYVSLQTGLVDGLEHDAPTILASKFYETSKFYSRTEHTFQSIPPMLSKRSFERIPANLRAGFLAAARDAVAAEREAAKAAETTALAELQQKGIQVNSLDKSLFEVRCKPLWNDYVAKFPKAKPLLDGILAARA